MSGAYLHPMCRAYRACNRATALLADRPWVCDALPDSRSALLNSSGDRARRRRIAAGRRRVATGVLRVTAPGAEVHTDEWHAYDDLDDRGRTRLSVNHKRKEWARDDDGDGVREVHSNSIEGFWLGLRNYLPPLSWTQQAVPRPLPRVLSGHAQLPARPPRVPRASA